VEKIKKRKKTSGSIMENVRPIRYRNTSQIDAQKLNTFYVIK